MARLNAATEEVTAKLDVYEIGEAGRALESFTDDLSRWYIRRSRRRFQRPEPADLITASNTLRGVLLSLAKLIAPFAPFFAEGLYQSLGEGSVHLEDWLVTDKKTANKELLSAMEEIRKISSDALALRAKFGIKVRQPLGKLSIKNKKLNIKDAAELLNIIKEEVNVKEVVFDASIKDELELDTNITPELAAEGLTREFTRLIQELRQTADYKPGEEAQLFAELPPNLVSLFEERATVIREEASLASIVWKRTDKFDAEAVTKLGESDVWLGIRR